MFIDVEVDAAGREDAARWPRSSPRSARSTSSRRRADGALEIVDENLDECTLCELCLAVPGKVKIKKLYDGGALLERHA